MKYPGYDCSFYPNEFMSILQEMTRQFERHQYSTRFCIKTPSVCLFTCLVFLLIPVIPFLVVIMALIMPFACTFVLIGYADRRKMTENYPWYDEDNLVNYYPCSVPTLKSYFSVRIVRFSRNSKRLRCLAITVALLAMPLLFIALCFVWTLLSLPAILYVWASLIGYLYRVTHSCIAPSCSRAYHYFDS